MKNKEAGFITVRFPGIVLEDLEKKVKALKKLPTPPGDIYRVSRNGVIVKAVKFYLAQLDV